MYVKQGGYGFYSVLYDPAGNQTHNLPGQSLHHWTTELLRLSYKYIINKITLPCIVHNGSWLRTYVSHLFFTVKEQLYNLFHFNFDWAMPTYVHD